jgi:hypothetical protein
MWGLIRLVIVGSNLDYSQWEYHTPSMPDYWANVYFKTNFNH